MKNALYFKFIMAYIFLGVAGFLMISTLGSFIIQDKILEDTGEALYKEAISIASDQADADYSDPYDAEVSYNNLKLLSEYQNARILVLNSAGEPLLDTARPYTTEPYRALTGFDPAAMRTAYYQIGTFYGYFQEDMVNSMVPITKSLSLKGYVSLHMSMDEIILKREKILCISFFCFFFFFHWRFWDCFPSVSTAR